MNIKEFLKPDLPKIVIFVVLLVIGFWVMWLPIQSLYQIDVWLGRAVFFIASYLIAAILLAIYKTIKR